MASRNMMPSRRPIVGEASAKVPATNIDRHTCRRVVPLQILALGVSRTGTSSLRQALLDLGYEDCYHYGAILNENPSDADMWVEACEAKWEGKGQFTKANFDQLLGHCMAITDTPAVMFYRELLEAYPEAKVILTLRDSPEQWWSSQMRTIIPYFERLVVSPDTWSRWLYQQFLPYSGSLGRMNELLARYSPMYIALLRDAKEGTRCGIAFYEDYCSEIQEVVPKERLLVMNVKEGWEPLCRFLGRDVPMWPFPNVNTSEDWNKNIVGGLYRAIDRQVYWNVVKCIGPVVVGMGAFAAVHLLRLRSI